MQDNFNRSLDVTLVFEGGYVNHPADPGGHTNKGITLATMRRYVPGATVAQLKAIPIDLVRRIYKDGYWDKVNGDRLATGVDLATFDYGVNSGPGAANKQLMKVIGGTPVQTIQKLCARRLSIYRTFRHWKSFGKGWTRRITAVEAKAVAWALAALPADADHRVKETLTKEAHKAESAENRNKTGAGGAAVGTGGGTLVTPDAATDASAAWVLVAAVVVIGIIATAILVRRAMIEKARKEAYRAEAAAA
jgi:lysozyme family protein